MPSPSSRERAKADPKWIERARKAAIGTHAEHLAFVCVFLGCIREINTGQVEDIFLAYRASALDAATEEAAREMRALMEAVREMREIQQRPTATKNAYQRARHEESQLAAEFAVDTILARLSPAPEPAP